METLTWAHHLSTIKTPRQSSFPALKASRPPWEPSLLPMLQLVNLFIPSWYVCSVMSLDIRTTSWVKVHPVSREWSQ